MTTKFSARTLASLELPGLPTTKRSIHRRANSEGWSFDEKIPQDGGSTARFYHLDSLPDESRQALIAHELSGHDAYEWGRQRAEAMRLAEDMDDAVRERKRHQSIAEYRRLTDEAQAKADARFAVVQAWRAFEEAADIDSVTRAREAFAREYSEGRLDLGEDVREVVGDSLSQITVYRWNKWLDDEGIARLAGKRGHRSERDYRPKIERDDEMRTIVHGMIHEYGPHVSARVVHEQLTAKVGENRVPSQRSVSRYLKRWRDENKSLAAYLDDPKTWRGSFRTALGQMDDQIVRPNQIWELDSTIADIVLETEDGGARRHALVGVIDVYTRRVRYVVSDQSRASAIAIVLRRGMLDWGIPETLRMDNGKDYTSKHVDMLTTLLDVDVQYCKPYAPEEKPFIERMYRTLQHAEMETLPGFAGHDVAERQKLRSRQEKRHGRVPLHLGQLGMTQVEFQVWLDEWCEHTYERREHSALEMSPWEKARRWDGHIRRVRDERVLDVLLEPVPDAGSGPGIRTVQKSGISVGGVTYVAPELAGAMREKVLCLYDPHAAGRIAVFDQPDMEFLCYATCPEGSAERRQIARQARRQQKKEIRDQVKAFRQAASDSGSDQAWKDIMAARAKKAETLKMMSKPMQDHETDATRAASDAADAREAMDEDDDLPQENSSEVRRRAEEIIKDEERRQREQERKAKEEQEALERKRREMEAQEEKRPLFDTEYERFQWINEQDREGNPISDKDRAFFHQYTERLGIDDEYQLSDE